MQTHPANFVILMREPATASGGGNQCLIMNAFCSRTEQLSKAGLETKANIKTWNVRGFTKHFRVRLPTVFTEDHNNT